MVLDIIKARDIFAGFFKARPQVNLVFGGFLSCAEVKNNKIVTKQNTKKLVKSKETPPTIPPKKF
jgi:hypothetical protein